jgi:hypothetical protein
MKYGSGEQNTPRVNVANLMTMQLTYAKKNLKRHQKREKYHSVARNYFAERLIL